MSRSKTFWRKFRGGTKPSPAHTSPEEIIASVTGAFVGILAVSLLAQWLHLSASDSLFLIGSFGASAVLIYGAPRSPFAQPRNLVVGHLVSALAGVSCASLLVTVPAISAAAAVASAIALMHLTHSIHPPGGATALIAVIGSDQVQALSYWYVLSPVMLGVMIMLVVALVINNLFPGRQYPEYWF